MSKLLKKLHRQLWCAGCLLMMLAWGFAGCASSGKPHYDVTKYLLQYPSLSWEQAEKIPASVKINRFSIAAVYNTTAMIFREDDNSIDFFNYSRWVVNPADMIADRLVYDLRESGLFAIVLSRHETDEGRFFVTGGIEEFYLKLEKKQKTALISISISLQDGVEKETFKKIMYQKKYTREEILQDQSPRGYSQAASLALRALSREIINDIYEAVQTKKAQDE